MSRNYETKKLPVLDDSKHISKTKCEGIYLSFVSGQKVLAIAEAFVNKCPKIYKKTD